jgi:hypothetical protein
MDAASRPAGPSLSLRRRPRGAPADASAHRQRPRVPRKCCRLLAGAGQLCHSCQIGTLNLSAPCQFAAFARHFSQSIQTTLLTFDEDGGRRGPDVHAQLTTRPAWGRRRRRSPCLCPADCAGGVNLDKLFWSSRRCDWPRHIPMRAPSDKRRPLAQAIIPGAAGGRWPRAGRRRHEHERAAMMTPARPGFGMRISQ